MRKLLCTALIPLFLFISTEVFAWGKTGHRVVAEIAENHLTKKAKKNINKITGNQSLVYWSDWPDFIKSDSEWRKATDTWHYLNFPSGLNRNSFQLELLKSSEENLYKRSLFLMDELKNNKNLELEKKQHYLYFLIHLIGDAHQPLHLGREEDLGGNKINVKWFKSETNLHSVWDTKIVDFQQYSYSEYAKILDFHTKKYNREMVAGSFEDWLFDCYLKAEDIYENTEPNSNLWFPYDYKYKNLLEEQLLKGGLRLAKILNDIFG